MIEESKSVWESNLNSEALTKRGESIRNFATDLQLEVVKMNNSLEIIQSLVSSLIAENVSSWKISGLIKHANLQEIIDKQRKEHDASKYTSSSWRTPSNAPYTMTSLSEQLLHNNLYGNGATPVSNMSNVSNETNTPDTAAYQSLEEICSSVASCCAMLELLSLIELQLDYFTFFEILFNNIQLPIEPPENQMNWPIIYFASSACSNALQKLKYIHNNWPKIFCEQEFDYFCDYLQKAITALFNSKDARKYRKKILQQQQPQQVSPQKQTSSTQTQNQTLQNQTLQNQTLQKQNLQKQNQSLQNQSLQNQGQQQKQQTVQTFHIDPNVSSKNQTNAHIQEIQQTTQTNKKNSSSSQNQIVKMVYLDPNNTSSKNQTNSQIQTQLQQTPTQKQTSTSSQNQTNAHIQAQSQTQQTPTQTQTSTSSQNQLNKKLNNDQNKQKRLSKHQQLIIQSQQQQQSQQANSIKFSSNSIKRTPSKVYLNLLNLLYQPPQEQMLQFITVDEHQRECFLEMLQLLSFKRISVEGYYCY